MLIPKSIRQWIAVFRGDVAPLLVLLSAMLGIWFGMTPGLYGVHVALLIVALVVNIHFGIFLLSAGLGKALCFGAAPLLYYAGIWTQNQLGGILDLMTAIPIIGFTDVSRYSVAGSLILGPIVGLMIGLVLTMSVQKFRQTWLQLEEGSEDFKRWMNKGWIKLLARLFIGKGASNASDIFKKKPKYVRTIGVILAFVVGGVAVAGASMIKGETLIGYAERSLTSVNGAQVDIEEIDLGILDGRISVSGIGATNPEQPTHNRLEIAKLTADLSLWELLCGRLVMEEVAVTSVTFENKRQNVGIVARSEEQAEVSEEESLSVLDGMDLDLGDVAKAESYFTNAEQIREHLRKLQEWLPSSENSAVDESTSAVPTKYLEYLNAAKSRSPTPRLVIRKLMIDEVTIPVDGLGNSRLVCFNLSDAPAGMSEPVVIEVTSKENNSSFKLTSNYRRDGGTSTVDALFADIDLAKLQTNLRSDNPVVLQGGLASATINGMMTREVMDVKLAVSTTGLKAKASGGIGGLDPQVTSEAMKVLDNLNINIQLVGPMTSPRLILDSRAIGQAMRDALVKAGKDELARRAGALLEGKLPEGVPDLKEGLPSLGGGKNSISGLLGDKSSEDSTSATKAQDKKENVKNQAEQALDGLFGKKKKKEKGND